MSVVSSPAASVPKITRGGSGLPSRVIFHSVEGLGKTSFAAHAAKPIFLMTRGETGLLTLIDNGLLRETDHFQEDAKSWDQVLGWLAWLKDNPTDHKTLVIDTLNGAERLCFESVAARNYNGSWESFMSYGRGPDKAQEDWIRFLVALDELREKRRMGVICLCHTKVKTFKNPEGDDYDRYTPEMHEKTWGHAHKWADIILFGNHETFIKKDKGELRAKGYGSNRRLLFTQRTAAWDAKNRWNLPASIDMGNTGQEAWANFYAAVRAAKQQNVEQSQSPDNTQEQKGN